jgi:hypothetical protein
VPIVVAPVLLFCACGVAQFWLYRNLRRALADRHPDLYLAMSRKAFFVDSAISRFAFSRACRALGDPKISSAAAQIRVLIGVGGAAWLATLGLMVTGLGFWPLAR